MTVLAIGNGNLFELYQMTTRLPSRRKKYISSFLLNDALIPSFPAEVRVRGMDCVLKSFLLLYKNRNCSTLPWRQLKNSFCKHYLDEFLLGSFTNRAVPRNLTFKILLKS